MRAQRQTQDFRGQPELENSEVRSPALGYESPKDVGLVQCLSHGFPTPLARWHYHEEIELHLITSTSGKAFVGDWIGSFEPGHLVLAGPRLPHNWISYDLPEGGVAERDLVLQFRMEPLTHAAAEIAELSEVMAMLERSRYGIEFFGMGATAERMWRRVKERRGIARFGAFCDYLAELAASTDYRLLSSVQMQGDMSGVADDRVNVIVDRITGRLSEPLSQADLAEEMAMTQSQFSRWFRRSTGNTFVDFVNRVRISRACQLLGESDRLISDVCHEVGFNNLANFNRRFLEIKGITPSEFRRQSIIRNSAR